MLFREMLSKVVAHLADWQEWWLRLNEMVYNFELWVIFHKKMLTLSAFVEFISENNSKSLKEDDESLEKDLKEETDEDVKVNGDATPKGNKNKSGFLYRDSYICHSLTLKLLHHSVSFCKVCGTMFEL